MQFSTLGRTLSFNWLLGIYSIIPLLIFIWVVDVSFFDSSLLPYMGMGSLLLPLYLLIFELPHIIASLLTFADRDYLSFYKRHLIIGLPIVIGLVGVFFYFSPVYAFLLYIIATMYHVIRQQTGVASMFARVKGVWFQVWSWSMVIATAIVFALVAATDLFTYPVVVWLSVLVFVLVLVSVISGVVYSFKTDSVLGKRYIWATTLMMVVAYFFVRVDYLFFAIFTVRFVHDITAFAFYIVHDVSRNQYKYKNIFYSVLSKVRLPLIILIPVASIFIAFLFRVGIDTTDSAILVVILLGFTHYYVESIMWKRESPHRQQISFAKK
jgi:hypothetical protein